MSRDFPDHLICDVEATIARAMVDSQPVSVPMQRGGAAFRYDRHQQTWLRAEVTRDQGLGGWREVTFGDAAVDRILAADLVACPEPTPPRRAMVSASRGGADATTSTEVDLVDLRVVDGGLRVPDLVHQVSWDGPDAVLVSHRSATPDGSRWQVRRLCRGQRWEQAALVHAFPPDRVAASVTRLVRPGPARYLRTEWLDHRRRIYALGEIDDGGKNDTGDIRWTPVPVPDHVRLQPLGDLALLLPTRPWAPVGKPLLPGSILSADLDDLAHRTAAPGLVLALDPGERLLALAAGRSRAVVTVRTLASTRLLVLPEPGRDPLELARADPATRIRATPTDVTDPAAGDDFWVEVSGPVHPRELRRVTARPGQRSRPVSRAQGTFSHGDFEVRTLHTSPDTGQPVAITVVAPRDLVHDGENPTILTGYGAFGVPGHLDYLDLTGPSWLDRPRSPGRRRVYAFAHVGVGVRSTEEPWTRLSATVDQFLDAARALVDAGICSPRRLGALGVSHGGLLVMNAVLDEPGAFGAVACRSAVLDLLDFPTLDGTSWIAEYGDPRDPAVRPALARLSPVHRITDEAPCPPALFWTARNDDRVSPTHARRCASRLRETGARAWYLETDAGGHDPLTSTRAGAHGLAVTAEFFQKFLAI